MIDILVAVGADAASADRESDADALHLPRLHRRDDLWVPAAPGTLAEVGGDPGLLLDLVLNYGAGRPNFTTESAARDLHLPQAGAEASISTDLTQVVAVTMVRDETDLMTARM